MKRVTLSIHSEKHPNVIFLAYALSNEVNSGSVNFFSTVKFQPDEELEVRAEHNGEVTVYHVIMTHLHEQISSGRIMNAMPDEAHPFPARTFYRCFTKAHEKTVKATPVEEVPVTAEASEQKAA